MPTLSQLAMMRRARPGVGTYAYAGQDSAMPYTPGVAAPDNQSYVGTDLDPNAIRNLGTTPSIGGAPTDRGMATTMPGVGTTMGTGAPMTGAPATGGLDPMPATGGVKPAPVNYGAPVTGGVRSPLGPMGAPPVNYAWGPTGAEQGAFRRENFNNPLQNGRGIMGGQYQGPSANQLAHNQAGIARHAGKADQMAMRADRNAAPVSYQDRDPAGWARMQQVQQHNDAFSQWLQSQGIPMPGVGQGSDLLQKFYAAQPQWAPKTNGNSIVG